MRGVANGGLVARWALLAWAALSLLREARAAEDAPVPLPPPTRRSGFAVGLSSGLSIASVSGYPNDVTKIDLPEFEARTGAAANVAGGLWVGTALVDWLTVGLGYQGGSVRGNGLEATGGSIHIRIEAFPLFFRGGPWENAGVSLFAGAGTYDVKRGKETVAEGEGTSLVGVGAFFEPLRFWQFSTGPDVTYLHQFSRSLSAHSLVIGWRLAFYAAP